MSTWLFDLGNTRLKCAALREDGIGTVAAVAHDGLEDLDADALHARLDILLPARIDRACVASVARESQRVTLLDALVRRCVRIELARTLHELDGLRIAYADPARLGVDRFLAMLGARGRVAGAVLVCGVGTAVTLDLVDATGLHRGGRIAPSPDLMREALHARAPHLPARGGAWVDWATDTDDGLASGCLGAAAALIREAHAGACTTIGGDVPLLLHGGGAEALRDALPAAVDMPSLVLDGLAAWARAGGGAARVGDSSRSA
jgi:type III pantothenate kinase